MPSTEPLPHKKSGPRSKQDTSLWFDQGSKQLWAQSRTLYEPLKYPPAYYFGLAGSCLLGVRDYNI